MDSSSREEADFNQKYVVYHCGLHNVFLLHVLVNGEEHGTNLGGFLYGKGVDAMQTLVGEVKDALMRVGWLCLVGGLGGVGVGLVGLEGIGGLGEILHFHE